MTDPPPDLQLYGLSGLPEVEAGADLVGLILDAAAARPLQNGDVLVVAQKIVSKAEGRLLPLSAVEPSDFARQVGEAHERDPRHMEVILRESRRIVRMDKGVLICETRHGFVCANAGVDLSNVPGQDVACLLPIDPDASAEQLRSGLEERGGVRVGVLISDTFGRPWREGATNVAIGLAGFDALTSFIGKTDA
jgi:coenzyme F420-0:L-glutamate ligase/coenzyme F420-1:gamma-L-glutamate ligase